MRAIDTGGLETPVLSALRQAAKASNTDFDYLLRTAKRESNFNPRAEAKTSSATGMFQFIEQTWFSVLARHGAKHGLTNEAAALRQTGSGRWEVADPAMRERILDLRYDPKLSALFAGELAQESAVSMERALGRPVSSGELYAAHFLGAGDAVQLIKTVENTPDAAAADIFPREAAANKPVFYDRSGKALSVRMVYDRLTAERPVADAPLPADTAPRSAPVKTGGPAWPSGVGLGNMILSPGVFDILAKIDPVDALVRSQDAPEDRKRDRTGNNA